jgi:hypothetical protein
MTVEFDERPWLILCEGETDKRFFDRLITKREIENAFQVRFPHRGGKDKRAGRSRFGPWLSVAYENQDFIDNVRAVLVVSDNDTDPAASLIEVKVSLMESDGFPIPDNPREVARKADFPALVIMMIPHGALGGLETLCVSAAYSKFPVQAAVETFADNTPAVGWTVGKQSKMKLQSIIAASCATRPDAGFSGHWWENEQYHIPLEHPVFDDIADFLTGFRALIEAA